MIFDLIASQYGYTFKQFGQMTFIQVFTAFGAIAKRREQELKFQARCMGAEIKDDTTPEKITETDRDKFERLARERLDSRRRKNV